MKANYHQNYILVVHKPKVYGKTPSKLGKYYQIIFARKQLFTKNLTKIV